VEYLIVCESSSSKRRYRGAKIESRFIRGSKLSRDAR